MFVEALATPVEKKMALSVEEMLNGLNDHQKLVVSEMSDGEYVYPARYIASDLGLPTSYVLKQMRMLKKEGFATYGHLSAEDCEKVMGSGYWLTRLGLDLRTQIRDQFPDPLRFEK
jgi:hypothetical protein